MIDEASRPPSAHMWLLVLRFLSELALLFIAALFGISAGGNTGTDIVLAVVLVVFVIAVWAVLIAPRAPKRLNDPWRLVLEMVLFVGMSVGAIVFGNRASGALVGLIGVACAAAIRALPEADRV